MKTSNLEEEIKEFLERWNRSIIEKDVVTAAQLRDDGYSATMPDGGVLTKEEEIALIASADVVIKSISTQSLEVQARRNAATVIFVSLIEGRYIDEQLNLLYKSTISVVQADGRWRATSSRTDVAEPAGSQMFDLASGEPPKRVIQNAYDRTAAGGAPGTSSAIPRSRPRAGMMPSN